jgi:hypothetical protein
VKKDLLLLAGIGAVVAVVFTIAAVRGALPALRVFNPLEQWPSGKTAAAFAIVLVSTLLSMGAILWSDSGLPRPSATLEWVYSSDEAAKIVDEYGQQRPQAVRGVLIDSIAFIPSYALLIAISCFWIARSSPPGRWSEWLVVAGWSAAFAAAMDYLENAGILAALSGVTTRIAPLTYIACQLKWVVACAAIDFALIAAVARLIQRSGRGT